MRIFTRSSIVFSFVIVLFGGRSIAYAADETVDQLSISVSIQDTPTTDCWGLTLRDIKSGHRNQPDFVDIEPTSQTSRIRLRWQTTAETDSVAYYIYRADSEAGENWLRINKNRPLIAAGTTTRTTEYVYYDLTVKPDRKYWYRVWVFDRMGGGNWALGGDHALPATAKPVSPVEIIQIRENGPMFSRQIVRESESGKPKS